MKRILVIEDAFSTGKLLEEWFNKKYELIVSKDGETGLILYDYFKPDLILLDLGLPKVHGHEICDTIRNLHKDRDTKIIVITSSDKDSDRKRAEKNHVDGYMLKPLDYTKLKNLVSNLLT